MQRYSMTRALLSVGLTVVFANAASAQVTVSLPDQTQTTLMTAIVAEQAKVVVPASVTFNVANVAASTDASVATVTVTQIALASLTKQLKISVQAAAASFTPPVVAATTWSASDVSWNAPVWTNAAGASGTLSAASATQVATCTAGVASCSTAALVFTLAAKPGVIVSGSHTLSVTWRFESIGL